jgi:hypothetical protein
MDYTHRGQTFTGRPNLRGKDQPVLYSNVTHREVQTLMFLFMFDDDEKSKMIY